MKKTSLLMMKMKLNISFFYSIFGWKMEPLWYKKTKRIYAEDIQSTGLFNRFFNEIFSIDENHIGIDNENTNDNYDDDESKYKFQEQDKNIEIDIRDVNDNKKAELFIHKWDIPYDKPMKDGCGERSEVNYMEFAEEHLRKIDTLSGLILNRIYIEKLICY